MKSFFTLSSTAGLIRTNKFLEKSDAVAIASTRAQQRGMPIKIFIHEDEPANKKCILVANPDGSLEKPKGYGYEVVEPDHHAAARNYDQANILLASADLKDAALTTIYLKKGISEYQLANLEKAVGCPMGLYDDRIIHCYTEDAKVLKKIEDGLAEASVEIDRLTKHKVQASLERVESATRRSVQRARASQLPELNVRAHARHGGAERISCYCELYEGTDNKPPQIVVYGDGRKLGEVKSDRDAARLMSEYAERAFGKFLKKELA